MQKEIFIAANWKMNLTVNQSKVLAKEIAHYCNQVTLPEKLSIMLAPNYLAANEVSKILASHSIFMGVQDMHHQDNGAFTSKISGSMIFDIGARFVILGHSELRQIFGETDEMINKKIIKALSLKLSPILCVGETLEEREKGKLEEILQRQIENALKDVSMDDAKKVLIAYEPVWAIGTGKNATAHEADHAHELIRAIIKKMLSGEISEKLRILYGGSMKSANAQELLSCENIDGGLIGGAALNTKEFCAIISIAKSICPS